MCMLYTMQFCLCMDKFVVYNRAYCSPTMQCVTRPSISTVVVELEVISEDIFLFIFLFGLLGLPHFNTKMYFYSFIFIFLFF